MGTKVIKVTLVIHKVNLFRKNIPLKLNYISCHGDKNVIKAEKIADFNVAVAAYGKRTRTGNAWTILQTDTRGR